MLIKFIRSPGGFALLMLIIAGLQFYEHDAKTAVVSVLALASFWLPAHVIATRSVIYGVIYLFVVGALWQLGGLVVAVLSFGIISILVLGISLLRVLRSRAE